MGTPTSGDDFLLYVDTNSVGATPPDPSTRLFVLVSGQKSLTNPQSLATADATDKDSDNWEESVATNRSSEKTVEGVREEGDPGQEALKTANSQRNLAYFKIVSAAGDAWQFQGFVTEWSEEAPQDDVVSFSATIKRSGAETEL
jgi:predicted secreted protein